MIQKKDIFIGLLIDLIGAFLGTFIALQIFTKQGFIEGFKIMKNAGMIGKVITLGCVPNLLVFFLLLKKKQRYYGQRSCFSNVFISFYYFNFIE